jgi:hypothetical protein
VDFLYGDRDDKGPLSEQQKSAIAATLKATLKNTFENLPASSLRVC